MDLSHDIAIVGMGGIFPGAQNAEQFWQGVLAGRSQSREVPAGRWPLATADAYDPATTPPKPDKVYSKRGCFVDPFTCDIEGLHITRDQLDRLDPMFHLLLHAGKAAWQDTVTRHINPARIGVIIGNIVLPTDASSTITDEIFGPLFESKLSALDDSSPNQKSKIENGRGRKSTDPLNRYVAGLPAGILAQVLGITGTAFTLDAACASSLYALKLAVDELRAGRADLMLTGGLSRPDCLYTQMGFSQLHALSPSGNCAPFDARADGLVVGEGAGILTLKRLADALRDGDHIYATIAGIGLSNDIAGNLMQPDSSGQLRAMRAAYRQAGWSPQDIDLIECHGTGTPLGDAVEFNSLIHLWEGQPRDKGRCVIGSVKSNVGHLLTAAGSAGLIKVLLAMRDRKLPPSANYAVPAAGIALDASPFTVLRKATDWPRPTDHPRRAAISGFGFGGINAHLLIQEWEQTEPRPSGSDTPDNRSLTVAAPIAKKDDSIAIVGMGAHFGPWQNLDECRKRIFAGATAEPAGPRNWRGAKERHNFNGFFIDEIQIPLGRFRIPPAELSEILPQQLLMLQVAADAFDDARIGIEKNPAERLDTGVFIGIGLDLNTTNFRFRWSLQEKARQWARVRHLDLTPEQLAAWTEQLRAAAGPALNANRTMGALGGIVASRIARAFHVGGPSFTISSEETSALNALDVAVRALQQNEINVALVGAVDLAGDLRAVLSQNALRPYANDPIGEGAAALILKRHEDALRDGDRIYALINSSIGVPPMNANTSTVAPTDIQAEEFGDAGVATPIAAVVKAALALHHETLPPKSSPDGSAQYWLRNRVEGPRQAKVSARSVAGSSSQVLLESALQTPTPAIGPTHHLFTLFAEDTASLLTTLAQLEELTTTAHPVTQLARHWFETHKSPSRNVSIAFVTESSTQLRILLDDARMAIMQSKPLQTDNTFYNPAPRNAENLTSKIAFVYPGSGTEFPGMGRDLAAQFPEILHRLDAECLNLASQFAAPQIWSDAHPKISPRDAIFAQVSLGAFVTDLLAAFALKPQAVIGYSLGESTALFSTRTWRARDEMLARMHASNLFTTELTGPCDAARRAWNLPPGEEVHWRIGVINRPADIVRQALLGRERVYLLIVNTPGECVIGGDRRAVKKLVRDLDAVFHPVYGVTTVHCEVARQVEAAYRDLHLLDTTPPEGVRFYCGALGRSYDVTRDSAADAIVGQAVAPFDFTQVIRTAYADGIRFFIEAGPGATCTRMIDQILEGQPHFAHSACIAGQNNVATLLRLLAHLISEGMPLELSALYIHTQPAESKPPSRFLTLRTGGDEFQPPPPPAPEYRDPPAEENNFTPSPFVSSVGVVDLHPLLQQMAISQSAHARAQETFLRLSQSNTRAMSNALSFQMSLLANAGTALLEMPLTPAPTDIADIVAPSIENQKSGAAPAIENISPALDYSACMEFAVGSISRALGPAFAHVDAYLTRVRLPDEPLMLAHRITTITAIPNALLQNPSAGGSLTTEHDIVADAWYLDANRIPTCIAVEAGQADLFLSGYLGIDSITKGLAVYRLLDAVVTFHAPLPTPGATIVYDIAIENFFRQGDTHLFSFHFEATINGKPFLSMQKGCAGFFTEAELAAGKGIVLTSIDKRPLAGKRPADWSDPVPMAVESYSDEQISALRAGNLAACFGLRFQNLPLTAPATLPGGGAGDKKRMTLVHRILKLDPTAVGGGRFGIGQITGEADIHPDDWFLTCHFIDDRVMPGTLMYECCLHTLRVYLLRMGWVGEENQVAYEPIPGISSQLKCRGQVTAATKKVQYEVTLKEIGYQPDGTPYVIADALMYADGKPIVQMLNMSCQLSGLTKEKIEHLWKKSPITETTQLPITNYPLQPTPLFDTPRITAFALGKPSEAFGNPYEIFDPGQPRKIARLPSPPYQFLDRITSIKNCEPFKLAAGAIIEAQYDVPPDAWYFQANTQPLTLSPPHLVTLSPSEMPFSILLEAALQPCGWLAAYLGSALTSNTDLKFRNLGGTATQFLPVLPNTGTLTTTIKITNVSNSGGMIIQHFDMHVRAPAGDIYKGTTYFGFFSKDALATQIGIRDAALYQPTPEEIARAQAFPYPETVPFPNRQMRMVDDITHFDPNGGPKQLGFIRGTTTVNPDAWFFKAHFFEDPVWPGSLGLESFIQLLKLFANRRWAQDTPADHVHFQTLARNEKHSWIYRGQILPTDKKVTIEASITHIDDARRLLRADGFLIVDNRVIYQMKDFTITMTSL